MTKLLKIKNGVVKAIYDDNLLPLANSLGKSIIKRATHVEFDNDLGKWIAKTADMGIDNISEPGLPIAITKTRKEAIDLEVEFLRKNM